MRKRELAELFIYQLEGKVDDVYIGLLHDQNIGHCVHGIRR